MLKILQRCLSADSAWFTQGDTCPHVLAAAASLSTQVSAARTSHVPTKTIRSAAQPTSRGACTCGAQAQDADHSQLRNATEAAPPLSLSGLQHATDTCTAASALTLVQQCQRSVQRRLRASAQVIDSELPELARLHSRHTPAEAGANGGESEAECVAVLMAKLPGLPGLQHPPAVRLTRDEAAAVAKVRAVMDLSCFAMPCFRIAVVESIARCMVVQARSSLPQSQRTRRPPQMCRRV